MEFSKWTVVIGRTGFGTISSLPDPTLSLRVDAHTDGRRKRGGTQCRSNACSQHPPCQCTGRDGIIPARNVLARGRVVPEDVRHQEAFGRHMQKHRSEGPGSSLPSSHIHGGDLLPFWKLNYSASADELTQEKGQIGRRVDSRKGTNRPTS